MHPHFLRRQLFSLIALLNLSSWCLMMVGRLFLVVPRGCLQFVIVVFPDHTHLLFLPKIWLHLYIEMIPHFLRIQCFYIKMRFFRQCNLYGINSISVIDAPLWLGTLQSCESYWGVRDNSKCFPGAFYLLFYQNGWLVNKIHRCEGFVHFMMWEPFYCRKHGMGIIYNHCPIVPRSDFQSA